VQQRVGCLCFEGDERLGVVAGFYIIFNSGFLLFHISFSIF
jgi:hypothetical protein